MARRRAWYYWVPTAVALAAAALQVGVARDGTRDRAGAVLGHDPRPFSSKATAIPSGIAIAAAPGEALRWRPGGATRAVRNDDIADADPIAGAETGSHFGFIDPNAATVEPREPSASGARTAWWAWTAPSSVRYTWQVTAMVPALALAVFSDDAEMTLVHRSAANRHGVQQLVFDAIAGTRYLIAAGVHASDAVAAIPAGPILFAWGSDTGERRLRARCSVDGRIG